MNRSDYIVQAVTAIQNQTFGDWELIIVDAGESIYDLLPKDPRICYMRQDGKGISRAVNQGMREACGDIINWSNDDDLMAEGTMAWICGQMHGFWTYGKCELIDSSGNRTGVGEFGGEAWDLATEKQRNLCPQPSVFWDASALNKVGYFDEDPGMDLAADWDYWIRLGEIEDPLVTQRIQAHYREHPDSITVKTRGLQDTHADAVRRKHG